MDLFFGSNLLWLRKQRGLSQDKTASLLGFGRSTYANWESGLNVPELIDIVRIADHYEVSLDNLLTADLSKGNPILKKRVPKTKEKGNLKGNPIGNLNEPFDHYGDNKRGPDPGQIDYRDELITLLKQVLESTRSELAEHKKSTLQILTNLGRMEADQQILLKNIMVVSEFLALEFGKVLKSPEGATQADLRKIAEHVETLAQKDK